MTGRRSLFKVLVRSVQWRGLDVTYLKVMINFDDVCKFVSHRLPPV